MKSLWIGIMILWTGVAAANGLGGPEDRHCHANLGPALGEAKITFVKPGATRLTEVAVSLPLGPRGAYITQHYLSSSQLINRAGQLLVSYKKWGSAKGPLAEDWDTWFPASFSTETGSFNGIGPQPGDPTYVRFKGGRGKLLCP